MRPPIPYQLKSYLFNVLITFGVKPPLECLSIPYPTHNPLNNQLLTISISSRSAIMFVERKNISTIDTCDGKQIHNAASMGCHYRKYVNFLSCSRAVNVS